MTKFNFRYKILDTNTPNTTKIVNKSFTIKGIDDDIVVRRLNNIEVDFENNKAYFTFTDEIDLHVHQWLLANANNLLNLEIGIDYLNEEGSTTSVISLQTNNITIKSNLCLQSNYQIEKETLTAEFTVAKDTGIHVHNETRHALI